MTGRPDPLVGLPEPWPQPLLSSLRSRTRGRTLVVVDDDPTGTQTVRDVAVLTDWEAGSLRRLLAAGERAGFILTNSRALPAARAAAVNAQVGRRLRAASRAVGRPISVVSRSDSTLRGHFPREVDALSGGLGLSRPRIVLVPYFGEAGRITVGDVHYLRRGGEWVPVSETEFARDPAFAYRDADLRAWAAERLGGDRRPIDSIGLEELRAGGPSTVTRRLRSLPPGAICIVNAAADRDLEVAARAVVEAEEDGSPLIVRGAASYVRAGLGQPRRRPLRAGELNLPDGPGLVVAGSWVEATTRQLERLRAGPRGRSLAWFELPVPELLGSPDAGRALAEEIAAGVDRAAAAGQSAVVATSRRPVSGDDPLADAASVAAAVVGIVAALVRRPAWLLAKGGITSSRLATEALGVRRARVIGQLAPGVPVWRCGSESRWPDLALVVFPGNVGDAGALARVVGRLQQRA